MDELVDFVAAALSVERAQVQRYVSEVQEDDAFEAMLRRKLRARLDRKRKPLYGRRLGWYAVARILKPKLIVETGIHDGLGSALLLQGLRRNAADGNQGQLVSIDIDATSGWLVDEALQERWTRVIGSSFDELERAIDGEDVGMIIHDSAHTYECQTFEFGVALRQADEQLALISDHTDAALPDICQAVGIEYRLFHERPRRHFYPGAGFGIGYLKNRPPSASTSWPWRDG